MAADLVTRGSLHERRRRLTSQKSYRHVDPNEFRALVISTRRLIRADDPASELRGVIDPESGTRFVTESEGLLS